MGGRTNERHDYDGRRITRNTISTIIRLLSRSEKIVQLIIDYFVRGGDSFLIWVTRVLRYFIDNVRSRVRTAEMAAQVTIARVLVHIVRTRSAGLEIRGTRITKRTYGIEYV